MGQEDTKDLGNAGDPRHLRPGSTVNNGQFTIGDVIGEGGFGITYEARDNLGRRVALKECFPQLTAHRSHGKTVAPTSAKKKEDFDTARTNFLREARVLAMIEHPNIVRVQSFFEDNDTAYMAMDFVQGANLDEIIIQNPERLTPNYVMRITQDLLSALEHLHDQRILHRDIKPSNIRIDRWGTPILIDFGTAKQTTSAATQDETTRAVVSDGYSPYEFYERGERQDPTSDLYSLAATLHHVISGTVPAFADQRARMRWEGRTDPHTPLTGRFVLHDASLLALIDRAMSMDLHERPPDAKAWLRTLPNMDTVTYVRPGEKAEKRDLSPRFLPGLLMGGGIVAALAIGVVLLRPDFLPIDAYAGSATGQLVQENAELQGENLTLQSELESQASLVVELNGDLRSIEDAREDLVERVAMLEARLAEGPTEETSLALEEARSQMALAETELARSREALSQSEQNLLAAEARLGLSEAQSAALESEIVAFLSEAGDLLGLAPDSLSELDDLSLFLFPNTAGPSSETGITDQEILNSEFLLDGNGTTPRDGPSGEDPVYLAISTDLQQILAEEDCGVSEIDGQFGPSSELAYDALVQVLGGRCGSLPVLSRVWSNQPVTEGWVRDAGQAVETLQRCTARTVNAVCRTPDLGLDCAGNGGCLSGGHLTHSRETFCSRYNDISESDWDRLFQLEDSAGTIFVSIETYVDAPSETVARARFELMERRLPSLPLRFANTNQSESDAPVFVAQLASGLTSLNQAHEIALYANICPRPGVANAIAPGEDAFAVRRGQGIIHIQPRTVEALGLDPQQVLGIE